MEYIKGSVKSRTVLLIVGIILLLISVPVMIKVVRHTLVDQYFPTYACGYSGSAWGVVFKTCECSGLKVSKNMLGSSKSVCFGECTNCRCWIYNGSFENEETVSC